MNSAPHLIARSLIALALLGGAFIAPGERSASTPLPAKDIPATDSVAGIRPEGRLRKLHLVRPDLIPYPIAYEVYC